MKDHFKGYYRPSETDFKRLWDECTFTFDTSILLQLYDYPKEGVEIFFKILEELGDRIWLSNQACQGYFRNRIIITIGRNHRLEQAKSSLQKAISKLQEATNSYQESFPADGNAGLITKEMQQRVEAIYNRIDENIIEDIHKDEILERLTTLFNGKAGTAYSEDEINEKYRQAESRYEKGIPPGYADFGNQQKKDEFEDAIIWFQIIDRAKRNEGPIILVTNDGKEDWWLREGGRIIGPRPELIQEIQAKAGIDYYQYRLADFIERAKKYLGLEISKEALLEITKIEAKESGERERINEAGTSILKYFSQATSRPPTLFPPSAIKSLLEAAGFSSIDRPDYFRYRILSNMLAKDKDMLDRIYEDEMKRIAMRKYAEEYSQLKLAEIEQARNLAEWRLNTEESEGEGLEDS